MLERLTPKSLPLETPTGSLSLFLYVALAFMPAWRNGLPCDASLRIL
jgi:hypothetical protein